MKSYRVISRHSPVGALIPAPNELTKQKLYKIKYDKYCLPFIDLAVGARVMATRNLATQIGIYNGATGIVVGFGFHTAIPEENFPTVNNFHTYTGTQLSTDVDKHSIVPFTECVHEIKLTVNGTHYMRWKLHNKNSDNELTM